MSVSYKIEVGKRLKEIRASMDMTQEQFCLFFGSTVKNKSMLSRYESGDITPPLLLFLMLAREGINLNWLFTGEGEMYLDVKEVIMNECNSQKEISMFHQMHNIIEEGNIEKIRTVEGLLNTFTTKKGKKMEQVGIFMGHKVKGTKGTR